MKNVIALAAASLFASTAVAHANTVTMTGTVKDFNPEYRMLQLDDGHQFVINPEVPTDGIRRGKKIEVIFEEMNGDNIAVDVKA